MKKRFLCLLLPVFMFALMSDCKLPSNIKIKTDDFKVSIPTKTGDINLGVITNMIRNFVDSGDSNEIDDFFPEFLEIYDMPDYPGMQAFLVAYKLQLTDSFNPDDYLDTIKNALKMKDDDSFYPEGHNIINPDPIVIPELTPEGFDDYIWLDMDALYDNMQSWINTTSVFVPPVGPFPIPGFPASSGTFPANYESPNIIAFVSDTNDENFESVFVDDGIIRIDFALTGGHGDTYITLNGIRLTEEGTEIPVGNNQPAGGEAVTLSYPDFTNFIEIDINDSQIFKERPPQLKIDSISYSNTGAFIDSASILVSIQLNDIALSGATKLKNTEMKQALPSEFVDALILSESDFPDEFLNAIIEDGLFVLEMELPQDINNDGKTTYFEGVIISYVIYIEQDQLADPEIPGVIFDGLSPSGAWAVTENPSSCILDNKSINRRTLRVDRGNSFLLIKTDDANDGANFNLFDDDMYNQISIEQNARDPVKFPSVYQPRRDKILPVKVKADFQINELHIIRWKTDSNDVFKIPDMAEINFENIDGVNVAQLIEEIMFEDISLSIDFTFPDDHPVNPGKPGLPPAFENRVALKVECEDIGLEAAANTKKINSGINEFSSVPKLFHPAEPPLTGTPKTIHINTQIIPIINGVESPGAKYIELGPIDIKNNKELELYGKIDLTSFVWEYAYINMELALESRNNLKGSFPTRRDRWWDLSAANNYMSGFRLGYNSRAKLFLGGPHQLMDVLKPNLSFSIGRVDPGESDENMSSWVPKFELVIPEQPLTMLDAGALPNMPGENERGDYIYRGRELPFPGQGFDLDHVMLDVISEFPKGLHFVYDLIMAERFRVTPTMFDDIETGSSSAIEGLFTMLFPLEFIGEHGAHIVFGDIFTADKDLFDRTVLSNGMPNNESSVFTKDLNIQKLEIKIDFDQQFFSGAYLHLDKNDKLFPGGINLNDGKDNSLTVKLNSNDWDIIKNNMIYPEMKLTFPHGTIIQIPRHIPPIRVTISASGSYNLNLDDLF